MILAFRFYDHKNKKMVYSDPTEAKDVFFHKWEITPKASPIVISTGLKDVNGVEVFKDDYVKAINRLHEDERVEKVTFLNGCFMFGNWNAHEFFNRHTHIEVVGNVFESK